MQAEVTDLIVDGDRVAGVRADDAGRPISKSAPTWWSAATAAIRSCASAPASTVDDLGAPIDVLWFRLSPQARRPAETGGHFDAGRILVMLNRGDYWQCAFVIPKGGIETVQRAGIEAFRAASRNWRRACATASASSTSWDDSQAADRQRRPAAAMAPAGPALHRRRGARHVAGRRRRHQPRRSGRGRRGEHPGRAAARRRRDERASRRRPEAPDFSS